MRETKFGQMQTPNNEDFQIKEIFFANYHQFSWVLGNF